MKFFSSLAILLSVILLLTSCEFKCEAGNQVKDKEKDKEKVVTRNSNDPVNQDGTLLYNGIQLRVHNLKISKAFLVFENNERVPMDNFIDFTSPVRAMIRVDSGWVEENGKVKLGASEKITTESGKAIADETDMYETAYPNGVDPEIARQVWLMADIHPRPGSPPGIFTIEFKVWDKNGGGYFEGSFKLNSK
ncbi:MAG TPA: hypothetical protein VLJ68_08135 [Chitinophagaceae bacterium]|nr:hypothetical protein [Chitinophagaceae bacterium]